MTKTYTYTHPTSQWVTVGEQDVFLQSGKNYELPSDNSYIASMEEQGYLVPVQPEIEAQQEAEPVKSGKQSKKGK